MQNKTRHQNSLDIHEDAIERLVHLYHLNALLPVHRIDDCMSVQFETLGQDQTIDVVVLHVHILSSTRRRASSISRATYLDAKYSKLSLTSPNWWPIIRVHSSTPSQ